MPTFTDIINLVRSFPTNSPIGEDAWQELTKSVPENMKYKDILNGIEGENLDGPNSTTRARAALVAVLACLKSKKQKLEKSKTVEADVSEDDEAESISRLCDYVATVIAPCWTQTDEDGEDTEPVDYDIITSQTRETSPYGLEILNLLLTSSSVSSTQPSDTVLLTLISFTDLSDPWTTEATCDLATTLLLTHLPSSPSSRLDDFVVETILKSYLRRVFSRSRPPPGVTSSGRKVAFQNQDEHDPLRGLSDETNPQLKPWKYIDHRAIPALHFAVRMAGESLIGKQWPLFIPVLLTLMDDTSTRIRSRGLVVLDVFLSKFPDRILCDTGLASVFEDAIFPALHFLPNITPEKESIRLLVPAYAALLTLAGKVNNNDEGRSKPAAKGSWCHSGTPKAKLLDKVLREGIFSAYFHCKEHIHIVEVLLIQTARVVDEMGIYAVKHLKDLIPMHSEIMTNPFAALAPSTLLASIESLQATIANCWPRLASTPAYQDELIKALVVCFLGVQDDQDKLGTQQFSAIEADLIKTAAMLSAVTKTGQDGDEGEGGRDQTSLEEKATPLIAEEPLLQKLFKSPSA